MHKFVLGLATFILLVTAQPVAAQTPTLTNRVAVIQELQQLEAQIQLIQDQIANLRAAAGRSKLNSLSHIHESRFYDGSFEAVYKVDRALLVPVSDTQVRMGDALVWDTFFQLVGDDFINDYVSEFRIFNDRESVMGAFIEQKEDHSWLLSVNRFGDDFKDEYQSEYMVKLLIHEAAHIPFFINDEYLDDFTDEFWQGRDIERHEGRLELTDNLNERNEVALDYYEDHEDDFVSDYAPTSPVEDLAESFVAFVEETNPHGNDLNDQKIRFFYEYPELIRWRDAIRATGLI